MGPFREIRPVTLPNPRRVAALIIGLTTLAACSEAATTVPTGEPTPPAGTSVVVAIEPKAPSLAPEEALVFAATVTGAVDTTVRWRVREAGGGTVDATGRYVAPASPGVFHVEAASTADPTVSAAATVTVAAPPAPVVVTVTPPAGPVDACHAITLAATVTGSANLGVTWSVLEGAAGGTVTAAGVYTAPATGGTYHLVATSAADPTRSATAAVTVVERVLSVQVNPPSAALPAGGSVQLTATVTTTCGSFASAATMDPTGRITAN
jgi:hypothetical protein